MRISSFHAFSESEKPNLTKDQIDFLDAICNVSLSKWRMEKGFVNIEGNFDASYSDLVDLKGLKFGKIQGNFDISDNSIKNLTGCPKTVEGDFLCSANLLTSLEGGPEVVTGEYNFANNDIFSTLGIGKGMTSIMGSGNNLESLEGCPESLSGDFFVANNATLQNLSGGPKEVGGDYDCSNCSLTSLDGCAQKVAGFFNCGSNDLETLDGGPEEVGGMYFCTNNKLRTLSGVADKIGKMLVIGSNKNLLDLSGIPLEILTSDLENKLSINEIGLPPEIVKSQLEFLRENKTLNGWLKSFIQKDYKRLPQIFNRQYSESGKEILDSLKLIEFSYESPEVLAQIVKFFPEWESLIVKYFKDNKDKFSPDFQEASGLYLDLKDLGF